jgi:hypothetical protein
LTHVRFNPDNRHRWSRDERLFRAMNRRQPTPSTGQSRATAASSIKLGKVLLDGTATNCVIISMSESCLGGTGQHTRTSRLRASQAPAVMTSSPRIPIIKNSDVRVRKRTEAPALVSHILVGRVRGGSPQQHLTTVEVGEWFSTPFMRAACASEAPGRRSDCC